MRIEKKGNFIYNVTMRSVIFAKSALEADKKAIDNGTPSLLLMERAARGMRDSHSFVGKSAIVCGSGNNGGDGYALATMLEGCDVFYIVPPATPDSAHYYTKCLEIGIPVEEYTEGCLSGYDTIVDCIFGVGLNRPVDGTAAVAIREINDSGAFVMSADVPSGLFADNGQCGECVCADMTVTFSAPKPGHYLNNGIDVCGELKVCDIGTETKADAFLIEKNDLKSVFHARKRNSNKGTYGYVTIMGGCEKYSGAAKLANMAASAMRVGSGVVKLAVGRSIAHSVSPYLLESTLYPLPDAEGYISFDPAAIGEALLGASAACIGMGMGHGVDTDRVVRYVIENYGGKIIIDADALNAVARMGCDVLNTAKGRVVITPHPGELARLCGCTVAEILDDPVGVAKTFAKRYNVVVLLKGCTTVITDGNTVYLCDKGCPGQATAGSGDVLSGVLCGILGYCDDLLLSAASATYLCGEAACLTEKEKGSYSMVASDTVSKLHEVILNIQD